MSIRSKLIIMFLAIALIPLFFVSMVSFHNYKNSLEAMRLSQLEDIATLKARAIESYFVSLKADLEISQSFFNIKENLPALERFFEKPNGPEFIQAKTILDNQLQKMQNVLHLSGILLTNAEGKVVYSSNPKTFSAYFSLPLPDPGHKAFMEGKKGVCFSDLFFSSTQKNSIEMLVSAPAFGHSNNFIGVIVFEVDMTPVYKLIQEVVGLGNTGEVLVGKSMGKQVVFLNPLRHDPQSALKRHVSLGGELGGPVQAAAQGKTGSGQLVDYRGKKVLAAWRHIPSLGWGMVAKIDSQEAFVEATNLQNLVMLILGIVLFLSGIMAFSVASSISDPIKRLSRGAEIIGKGNLEHKVATDLQDEIGQLSRTFDQMTHNLKTVMASRDELNIEIVERRRAEEALREARDYLENIFNYSNAPFICWDPESKITRFNPAFERLTLYTADEVMGKDLGILFPENSKEESLVKIARTLAGEHFEVVEIPVMRKDGAVRIALWNSANVYAVDGKTLIATIAQGQDITERKNAEEGLKRSNENLEQFAYVASHDLQEPLRIMASYSQLLERRYKDKLDQDAKEFIDFIVDAASRMQRLITDLLAYSRLRHTELQKTEIDCNQILKRVVESMALIIKEANASVVYDELPKIKGHEVHLTQLFQNLIGNAIKFHGHEAPQIRVSARRGDGEWLFSVKDNGIGIEPQYYERIFQIFQRLHGKEEYAGTGIGLAICKKIVENHGGRIWVESTGLNQGTTFYFTIPGGKKNG